MTRGSQEAAVQVERLDLNHLEQLDARVERGRQDRLDVPELVLMALGLDPFGEAERVIKGTLEDPNIDVATKTWVLALLATVDPDRQAGLDAARAASAWPVWRRMLYSEPA